jgi:hypothetical protein
MEFFCEFARGIDHGVMTAMQTIKISDRDDRAGDGGGQSPAADQMELVGHHVFLGQSGGTVAASGLTVKGRRFMVMKI